MMIKEKLQSAWNWTKRHTKAVLIGIGIVGVVSAGGIIEYDLSHITGLEMVDKLDKAPKKIKDKYVLEGASLKATPKNDPKDRIEVKVGGKDEFKPKIEIQRWDNEVNFSVQLIETETGNPTLNFEGEKIKWSKGNIDVEYYPYEGGHKMVWFLKEKPATNKVEFTLQSKDVVFYYQPELTQKEIDEGAERPENVVGSYAVYHKTKGGMNDINGMDYKAGKFGHIYRPHLYDSNGLEAWGDLHIENGIYSVEIPQEFLDKAVYPIKSNDEFGYTSDGASSNAIVWRSTSYYTYRGGATYVSGGSGTLDSLSIYIKSADSGDYTLSLFLNDEDSGGSGTHAQEAVIEDSVALTGSYALKTLTAGGETINNDSYIINQAVNGTGLGSNHRVWNAYDTGGDTRNAYIEVFSNANPDTAYANSKENPWTGTKYETTNQFSIYATYTPAGGEERRIIIIE